MADDRKEPWQHGALFGLAVSHQQPGILLAPVAAPLNLKAV